ncbi:MAG: peptide deformylase [Streptococcaceae bacterium]|jgi:peptide deformylase|nr:peptide deformylase [Streptococcaceae bacterium]
MILEVKTVPAAILRAQARDVSEITPKIIQLLNDLYETMIAHDGVGIAAHQVGENLNVAIVQLNPEDEVIELINPKIVLSVGSDIFVEGCLSTPHVFGTVERSERIVLTYLDREGYSCELDVEGYLARAIQHEVDHLNGILFIDKMIDEIKEEDLEAYYQNYEEESDD